MRKKIIIFLAGAVLCLSVAWYWYNKPRTGVVFKTTDASVTAKDLYDKYQTTEAEANKLYLDKVIEVSGQVDEIVIGNNDAVIMLGLQGMGGISCRFSPAAPIKNMAIKKGMPIVIKGRCTGFNIDVNLVDCIVIL